MKSVNYHVERMLYAVVGEGRIVNRDGPMTFFVYPKSSDWTFRIAPVSGGDEKTMRRYKSQEETILLAKRLADCERDELAILDRGCPTPRQEPWGDPDPFEGFVWRVFWDRDDVSGPGWYVDGRGRQLIGPFGTREDAVDAATDGMDPADELLVHPDAAAEEWRTIVERGE